MFGQLFKRPPTIQPEEIVAQPPADATADWESVWQAANDDAARAACIRSAPRPELAIRAIQAIDDEALLRELERDTRDKDRRLHSAAKQGLQRAIKTRQAVAEAEALIAAAAALETAPRFAANQLAELKQNWAKLDLGLVPAPRCDEFAAHAERLTARLQDFAARHRERGAWLAAAEALAVRIAGLAPLLRDARATIEILHTSARACAEPLQALQTTVPDASDGSREARAVAARLPALQQEHTLIAALLAKLDLLAAQTADPTADLQAQWQALAPLPAAELNAALQQRWKSLRAPAPTPAPAPAATTSAPLKPARSSIAPRLQVIETDLAEGHLDRAAQQLAQLLAEADSARWPEAEAARLRALQAEAQRLRKWRDWGGAQARETLVTEAETLARSVAATATQGGALPVHQLETYIAKLREQWKALNVGGGAVKPSWWERFDGALKSAYEPVQAHKAVQRSARRDNRAARERLLDELEQQAFDAATPEWKAITQVLHAFKAAWRELGPLEHTVDKGAREALRQRHDAALARLEQPLRAANAAAEAERRLLIERAAALAANPPARDAAARVRALQEEWQTQSRRHPLPQAAERALWQAFRKELDALRTRQAEAAQQRQGAQEAARAARQALIDQLRALSGADDDATLRKALSAADAAWRAAPALERGRGTDLERGFETAKTEVKRLIGSRRQREWQVALDALKGTLRGETAPNEALQPLPAAWRQALAKHETSAAADADETLLRLEMALDLPSPADQADARRLLKFAELKRTMENHGHADNAGRSLVELIATLLRQTLRPAANQRLGHILAALREREPLR